MSDEKVAAAATASENAEKTEKGGGKTKKKEKFVNPFSYTDELQSKFVNCIMKNGKKTVAQRILKDAFDEMNRRKIDDVMGAFEKACKNATPTMEAKAKRVGGSVYQIPLEVPLKRQRSLAIRWLLAGARKRKGMPMYKRLASELMDCASEAGFAFNKREESHRMAAANKAFAHLARY